MSPHQTRKRRQLQSPARRAGQNVNDTTVPRFATRYAALVTLQKKQNSVTPHTMGMSETRNFRAKALLFEPNDWQDKSSGEFAFTVKRR